MSQTEGKIHIDVVCSACGEEMIELAFKREESDERYIWTTYRKCPKCATLVEM
jgi:hypothetical protein